MAYLNIAWNPLPTTFNSWHQTWGLGIQVPVVLASHCQAPHDAFGYLGIWVFRYLGTDPSCPGFSQLPGTAALQQQPRASVASQSFPGTHCCHPVRDLCWAHSLWLALTQGSGFSLYPGPTSYCIIYFYLSSRYFYAVYILRLLSSFTAELFTDCLIFW